jgi:hypothetical protein
MKGLRWLLIILTVMILIFFLKSCLSGINLGGTGLGTVADIEITKYPDSLYPKYVDSFFRAYPRYRRPDSVKGSWYDTNYSFLNCTPFYFANDPREIYYVQWEGTGFITVRYPYDIDNKKDIVDNESSRRYVDDKTKSTIKYRFQNEVIGKMDSLIHATKRPRFPH